MSEFYIITKAVNKAVEELYSKKGYTYSEMIDFGDCIDSDGSIYPRGGEQYIFREKQIRDFLFFWKDLIGNTTEDAIMPRCLYLDDNWFRPVDDKGNYTKSLFEREPIVVLKEFLQILEELKITLKKSIK